MPVLSARAALALRRRSSPSGWRRLELIADGLRTSQFAPAHPTSLRGDGPLRIAGSEVGAAQNHLWFPSLKFNVLPGHPNLSIRPLWPTRPQSCAGYLDCWFGPDVKPARIDELLKLDAQSAPRTPRS